MSGTNIAWFRTKGFVSDEEEKGKGLKNMSGGKITWSGLGFLLKFPPPPQKYMPTVQTAK